MPCLKCNRTGYVRRFSIGGSQQPMRCPHCSDGTVNPSEFADLDIEIGQLKAQIKPSTPQHAAGD